MFSKVKRAWTTRLDETAKEREICLAKCREVWKNKTAEARGKQKEYQRVCRQQTKAAKRESTEETWFPQCHNMQFVTSNFK